jgi:hypothetical protein
VADGPEEPLDPSLLELEPSIEDILKEGMKRLKDRKTWKVWQWLPDGTELYEAEAFRQHIAVRQPGGSLSILHGLLHPCVQSYRQTAKRSPWHAGEAHPRGVPAVAAPRGGPHHGEASGGGFPAANVSCESVLAIDWRVAAQAHASAPYA